MTIPKNCKRLAEVDFPLQVVGDHALSEKATRSGTPHQLHLWWAWRPLASSRAMLLALLLPDPCDINCPKEFKSNARRVLSEIQKIGPTDEDLKKSILKFIGDFASWEMANNNLFLTVSRGLIKSAYPDNTPLVVDPFSGGGSIPLEALRIGCDVYSTDLNPVAGLILRVKLNDMQRNGASLIERVWQKGKEILEDLKNDLKIYYPTDKDKSIPIAFIWARTIKCEAVGCGAEIPLARSFWLSKKSSRKRALRYSIKKNKGSFPEVVFEIFEPKIDTEVPRGSIRRAKAECLCCGKVLSPERVRAQLIDQKGGSDVQFDKNGNRVGGALLLAVAIIKQGTTGRKYRLASAEDYRAVWEAHKMAAQIETQKLVNGISVVPDEHLPLMSGTFNAPIYGANNWGCLFTARQKVALAILSNKVRSLNSDDENLPVKESLALVVSKLAERANAYSDWMVDVECPGHLFTQQAIPQKWDFAESNILSGASGSYEPLLENTIRNMEATQIIGAQPTSPQLADAQKSPLPDDSCSIWFTDPPYYYAIPYADLSDFFYVWLKRILIDAPILKNTTETNNPLTPKSAELTEMARWDPDRYGHKNQQFFEEGMTKAFKEGKRVLEEDGIGCVVFAHKTTEGWEALLSGMVNGGWTITSSWPIATERSARMRAKDSAALESSVHLICRPRPEDAAIGDWTQVSRELPKKVGEWMQRLQKEGVRGADLVFACIGPALEIYSRYAKVVDAEDREIPLGGDPESREPHLRGYLAYVWEVVGRLALEQVLGTGETLQKKDAVTALEEDARLTALFLWTQQAAGQAGEKSTAKAAEFDEESEPEEEDEAPKKKSKGGYSLPFDVVRRFAQPLGIHLPEWENRIINIDKGVVTLLAVKERARQLFGEEGAGAFASEIEDDPSKPMQMSLFSEPESAPKVRGRRKSKKEAEVSFEDKREATTLDRLHAAMLLQKNGQTNALRALLQAESERGSDFMRLANALSALYPRESEEKRLLDALLVNVRK